VYRRSTTVGACALLIASLVGGASSGIAEGQSGTLSGTLTIEWSPATTPISQDPFTVWMSASIKAFEKANPQVSFDVADNLTNNDQYLTKLTTQMATGHTPDVFVGWTGQRIAPYAEAGRLLNLAPYLAQHTSWRGEFSRFDLSTVTFKGGIYGLPLVTDSEVMFYNKALFAKYGLGVPSTYAEFQHVIAVIRSHGVTPIALGDSSSWQGSILFTQLAERLGGMALVNKVTLQGKGSFDNRAFVQAGKLIQQLVQDGAFNGDYLTQTETWAETALETGQAAMWDMGNWDVPQLYATLKGKLGWFEFPSVPGGAGNGEGTIANTDDALALSPTASNKALAVDFLEFLFARPQQVAFAKEGNPVSTDIVTASDTNPVNASISTAIAADKQPMFPWDDELGTFLGAKFDDATQEIYEGQNPVTVLKSVDQARSANG